MHGFVLGWWARLGTLLGIDLLLDSDLKLWLLEERCIRASGAQPMGGSVLRRQNKRGVGCGFSFFDGNRASFLTDNRAALRQSTRIQTSNSTATRCPRHNPSAHCHNTIWSSFFLADFMQVVPAVVQDVLGIVLQQYWAQQPAGSASAVDGPFGGRFVRIV